MYVFSSDLGRCWTNLPSDEPWSDAVTAPQKWSSCCRRRTWIRTLLWFQLLGILSPRAERGWQFYTADIPGRFNFRQEWNDTSSYNTHSLCGVRDIDKESILSLESHNISYLCALTCGSLEGCAFRSLWRKRDICRATIHCGWTCGSWDLLE